MAKGSQMRKAAYAIDPIFIDRWSPRAMSGTALALEELMVLFEAARWAPSSSNLQPWRMLYALRAAPDWPLFLGLLSDANRQWAQHGGALVAFLSNNIRDDGRPAPTHAFDTGAAWENFALQASTRNLVVHGMQGFDHVRARAELKLPPEFDIHAMVVVGKPGEVARLPESLRAREQPSDRRPLHESVCEGPFCF
jgi:nitroreductase